MPIKLAFLDPVGLKYDGGTLTRRGLGGSESATIYMARELARIDFDVTVFCNAETEGIFDGVKYIHRDKFSGCTESFDVLICLRSVLPFGSPINNCKFKAIWLHDTFCAGDNLLEQYCLEGRFDEIFTLSDWHTNYILNGHKWRGRYFEVLKNKVWQTRNGIRSFFDEMDIPAKDPDLFVFNSAVSKGMPELLEQCWGRIRQRIPAAKIKIIGGYYHGADHGNPDVQEIKWNELKARYDGRDGVEFTGVIRPEEVAGILAEASLMVYPCAFPETYGISTLEAINYNVPLVGCRFGALEEVAAAQTSYLIDYDIKHDPSRVDRFVDMVVKAHDDAYLRKQKAYACNEFKPWIGWDNISLQWKQHICRRLDLYMPKGELARVQEINRNVQRIFRIRFINAEDIVEQGRENHSFIFVTPVYNAENYIGQCIRSVANQDYGKYKMYIIDDVSTDNTVKTAEETILSLPAEVQDKFWILSNTEKAYAVTNQADTIQNFAAADDVVILLDGDDWLANDPGILSYLDRVYDSGCDMTYGSCHSLADNIDLVSEPYPKKVQEEKSYRKHLFTWGLPYTHLRTFKKTLFDKVDKKLLKDPAGNHWQAGGDNALFYGLLEQSEKVECLQRILMVYNDRNPLNDYKVNPQVQTATAKQIRALEPPAAGLKILIATPTAKYIECDTFKSIYRLKRPDNVTLHFECFYGYNIDQVRNLMCDYGLRNGFDYVFFVDSDIVLPADSLIRLLSHKKDIVSGVYIQRKAEKKIPEAYVNKPGGGMRNLAPDEVPDIGLIKIDGCGFGCAFVSATALKTIGYPQFEYHDTLDFKFTISEDVDFCRKAAAKGIGIYLDAAVRCVHIGTTWFVL